MMFMEQRDERVQELEQSLNTISKFIENQQRLQGCINIRSSLPPPVLIEPLGETTPKKISSSHPYRAVRMDFPRFEGNDVLHWIFKKEPYFEYFGVEDMEILQLTVIHFEGYVVPW